MVKRSKTQRERDARDAFDLFHNKGVTVEQLAARYGVSAWTIQRWLKWARERQSPVSHPPPIPRARPRKYPAETFDRILGLKRELPGRTAEGMRRILLEGGREPCPSSSTIRKFLTTNGLGGRAPAPRKGYVKFQRKVPNDLWQIDIAGVQTVGHLGPLYLVAIMDDCSRFVVAARYFRDQSVENVLKVVRDAIMEHGRPRQVIADRGRQFYNPEGETKFTRLLKMLDVEPIFAKAHHPQTKGKLERWFGTARGGFLLEARLFVEKAPGMHLHELNARFQAWLKWYNYNKPHRSLPGKIPPAQAFFEKEGRIYRPLRTIVDWTRWTRRSEPRKVDKYSRVSYKTLSFQVPPGHVGCWVDVVDTEAQVEIYFKARLLAIHPLDPGTFVPGRRVETRTIAKSGTIQYKRHH